MSLINKVLNDLDQRNPQAARGQGSAVEAPSRSGVARWAIIALLVLLLIVLGWWLFKNNPLSETSPSRATAENTEQTVDATPVNQTSGQDEAPSAAAEELATRGNEPLAGKREPSADKNESLAVAKESQKEAADTTEQTAVTSKAASEQSTRDTKQQTVQPAAQETPSKEEQSQQGAQTQSSFSKQGVQLSAAEVAERQWQKAKTAQQQGLFSDAAERYRDALNALPQQHDIRKEWAALEFGRGQASQALAILREGLASFPDAHSLRLLAASMLEKQGQPQLALQLLRQAVPNAAQLPQYYQLQANLAQQLSQTMVMRDSYQALIGAQPENGRWHLGLALALREQQPQQALTAFEQAAIRIEHTPTLNFIAEQIKLIRSQHATSSP